MTAFVGETRFDLFETLDSTSAEARRRAAAGETGPVWIIAREQTAGYGRRGRAWESGAGNFAGTLLFRPDGSVAHQAQLSFVAALAVFDALEPLARQGALSLKWPNDVLAGDAKISGLLLERLDGDGGTVGIGLGVNLIAAPSDLPYPAARLIDVMREGLEAPTPEEFARSLDRAFRRRYETWRGDGFAPVRAAWLDRAAGLGRAITVRLPAEELEGVFDGLDEGGSLVLRQGEEKRIISAGDVFFGASSN
ncbi:MAG: biotin--[acetyl-CoA-carboxylase] ligase [Pseudomonadota bacterium]